MFTSLDPLLCRPRWIREYLEVQDSRQSLARGTRQVQINRGGSKTGGTAKGECRMLSDGEVERVCFRTAEILAPDTALPPAVIQAVRAPVDPASIID